MVAPGGREEKQRTSVLKELEKKEKESVKLNQTLRDLTAAKQKLEIQRSENENVLKELKRLESDAVVHKLVGPVLLKQSKEEAETTVTKRLEYINCEIDRATKHLKEKRTEFDALMRDIMKRKESLQQQSG